jgi:subtilase family serine protease
MTVAVVDAGDLPTAEADLAAYRSQFDLPPCTTANGCFRKVNQTGGTDFSNTPDVGWGLEIALDIEMVSAACRNCNILLVEADSYYLSDLGTAVNTAVSMGAIAVSNSYGSQEYSTSGPQLDKYYNHPGVAITVATGDCGYNCAGVFHEAVYNKVEYPAASQYVIAVGGTRLTKDGSARGWTESAWGDGYGGAGSGCSLYEPKPSWQRDTGCSKRTQADVSAVADPATGVAVYENSHWYGGIGGTSAASPIIAAIFALAHAPMTADYPASYLYANTGNLNDVTAGNNDVTWGNCAVIYLCNGVVGYDGPTGLGTPNGIVGFAQSRPTTYHALTPTRILDTRDGTGLSGALSSYAARTFQVTARGGVPASAVAVTGNLTVTDQTSRGYLYIGPNATNFPTSSTLNFPIGDDRANGVTVALGAGGTLSVTYVASVGGATADVVFDVTGYFTPDYTGATYHALTPTRILDSRVGNGLSGAFSSSSARTFQVTSRGGVPANAGAVTGNLTVTNQTVRGYLYMGPNAVNNPTSSTLNFPTNDNRANGVTVALGAGGTLSVTYAPPTPGTADVVFDVTGYFTSDTTGATYIPLTPARILDSRNGTGLSGAFGSGYARSFQVTYRGGVPTNATAVTGNLTVTDQTVRGYLYMGPNATNDPTSSTLNFPTNDDRANGVTVALSGTGTLWVIYATPTPGTADVVFDVTGYFVPGS